MDALSATRRPVQAALGILLALLSCVPRGSAAEPGRSASRDPIARAEACEAAVLALCIQEEGYGVPATFQVRKVLAGSPPSTLHVNVVDQEDVAAHASGRSYVLLLRAPRYVPFEIPSQKGRVTWPDAEAVGFPGITDEVIVSERDRDPLERARELLALRADDPGTQRSLLKDWLGRADSSRLPGIALEGFLAHPGLWDSSMESTLMGSLPGASSSSSRMARARLLGLHPTEGTRRLFFEKIASREREERELAAALCAHDSSRDVRAELVRRAADSTTAAEALPCLRAENSEAERSALSDLARGRIPGISDALRAAALVRLGSQLSDADWRTFRSLLSSRGMEEMWPWLADSVLLCAPLPRVRESLGAGEPPLRAAARRAAASRGDLESGRRLEEALASGRLPGGGAAEEADRIQMLESLGRIGSSGARDALVSHLRRQAPDVQAAAARGLGFLGDRSAAAELRRLDGEDCDPRHYNLNLAVVQALSQLGDSSDCPRFEAWARRCDTLRGDALEGLGLTCGLARMGALMDELTGPSADLAVVRSLSMLGAKVRKEWERRAAGK